MSGLAVATPENQERHLTEVLAWSEHEDVGLARFAAFDEPWKDDTEWDGVSSHWGLFDSGGVLKPGPAAVLD
ncbi:MAG: hypothetical protein P8R42_09495 [Candidatus Binatia bacterium]|nr:hypothetical protein [Candidatus Binatia bacterium]